MVLLTHFKLLPIISTKILVCSFAEAGCAPWAFGACKWLCGCSGECGGGETDSSHTLLFEETDLTIESWYLCVRHCAITGLSLATWLDCEILGAVFVCLIYIFFGTTSFATNHLHHRLSCALLWSVPTTTVATLCGHTKKKNLSCASYLEPERWGYKSPTEESNRTPTPVRPVQSAQL